MLCTHLPAHVGLPALLVLGLLRFALLASLGGLDHLIPQLSDLPVSCRNLLLQLQLVGLPLRDCLGARDPAAVGSVIEHRMLEGRQIMGDVPVQLGKVDLDHPPALGLDSLRLDVAHGMGHTNLNQELADFIPANDVGRIDACLSRI